MKKSVFIRLGCLVVAAAVLSGALIVAAFTGSPYETLKQSVLDTMMLKNGAVTGEFTYSIDGVTQSTERFDAVTTENGSLSRNFDDYGAENGFSYRSESLFLNDGVSFGQDGTHWYYGYIPNEWSSYSAVGMPFGIGGLDAETRSSASMRFIELAIDALVGDLKNNVAMSEQDGVRRVSGTLTASQIPALASAALDMIAEQGSGNSYRTNTISVDLAAGKRVVEHVQIYNMKKTVTTYEQTFQPMTQEMYDLIYSDRGYNGEYGDYYGSFYYPEGSTNEYMITSDTQTNQYTVDATRADYSGQDQMNMPMSAITVEYVHGEADIDAAGNLISAAVNGTATITTAFGDSFTLELRGSLGITDIGTARAACPIPDAERVLTRDFIKSKFGNEGIGFYFKLNPDGSVDLSSVTTLYPGESRESTFIVTGSGIPADIEVTIDAETKVVNEVEVEVPENEPANAPEDAAD